MRRQLLHQLPCALPARRHAHLGAIPERPNSSSPDAKVDSKSIAAAFAANASGFLTNDLIESTPENEVRCLARDSSRRGTSDKDLTCLIVPNAGPDAGPGLATVRRAWHALRPNQVPSWADLLSFPPSSGKVVAIKVHHLVPRSHEVLHKRLLRVVTCIDFREGPELGVRTEDKVDTGAGPLDFARRAIAPLKHAFG